MATNKISDNLMVEWVKHPDMKTDQSLQKTFSERFIHLDPKDQYHILAYMFTHFTETENQYWIMETANTMLKENSTYKNSQFKNPSSMVDFFIKQYSFSNEIEELRTTIWAIMK